MTDRARRTDLANPLWDYALALYGREGVAEACLALQDRLGLDVNLLLLCCWGGTRGRGLDRDLVGRLHEISAPWQREVVRPLRGVRRWLKPQSFTATEALRTAVKARELEAERIELAMLYEALEAAAGPPLAPGPGLAAANLRACLAHCGIEPGNDDLTALAALLRGAFPEVSDEDLGLLRLG